MGKRLSSVATLACVATVLLCGQVAAQQFGYPGFGQPDGFTFNGARIVTDIVAALLGFIIGAFFSPLLRPFRRMALFGVLIFAVLFSWFYQSGLSTIVGGAINFLAFFVALGYGIRLGLTALQERGFDPGRPTSFGTAKWATFGYLNDREMFSGKGFFLGDFLSLGKKTPLHYGGARHLLTVAPTRSGKGVASIVPNLLTYEGSVFVIDPKGENALITAARRGQGDKARGIAGLGQSVFLLDPWNIAAGDLGLRPAHFNPLDWIKASDPDAAENAFLLADALVHQEPGHGDGENRFWDEETKAYLTGLILFVATAPSEAANRTLGRVRDIINMSEPKLRETLAVMAQEQQPIVRGTAARTVAKDPKLLSNVMAAVQSHTHFLDSQRIRDSLSSSDFSFDQLKSKPTTVYLILPADRLKTFDRFLRLLIQQAITVNARNIKEKPPRPVLFLLDEMASLGRLTMVEQAFGLMAGFGMVLWGIVQDLNQLETLYGNGWQTFISNSGVIQYFGSRDQRTAEYFSTLCGVTTVRIFSLSRAIGEVIGSSLSTTSSRDGGSSTSGTNESRSDTHTVGSNESQRKLAYPDELMVLQGDDEIVFVENFDPIRAIKVRWFDDPKLKPLGVDLQGSSDAPPPPPKPAPVRPGPALPLLPSVDQPKQAAAAPRPSFEPKPFTFRMPTPQAVPPKPAQVSAPTFEPELPGRAPIWGAEPAPPPRPPREEASRYQQGDVVYVTYSDNSIDRVRADGTVESFASLEALKSHFLKRPN